MIDTAEKRCAALNITPFTTAGVGVTPNVTHDVEWRQEAGRGYPGIAPASPSGVTYVSQLPTLGAGMWLLAVLNELFY